MYNVLQFFLCSLSGYELFVGQLPYSCEEYEVKKFLKKKGFHPIEVRMPRDRNTGQPRGSAIKHTQ